VHPEFREKTHEHIEKPVVHSTEVKQPIVEKTKLEKEVVGETGLEEEEHHKKGLGTKIKEFFTGKDEDKSKEKIEIKKETRIEHKDY
jgi:hypothetical protein